MPRVNPFLQVGADWTEAAPLSPARYMHGEYAALISAAHERKSCAGLETSWHQRLGRMAVEGGVHGAEVPGFFLGQAEQMLCKLTNE